MFTYYKLYNKLFTNSKYVLYDWYNDNNTWITVYKMYCINNTWYVKDNFGINEYKLVGTNKYTIF